MASYNATYGEHYLADILRLLYLKLVWSDLQCKNCSSTIHIGTLEYIFVYNGIKKTLFRVQYFRIVTSIVTFHIYNPFMSEYTYTVGEYIILVSSEYTIKAISKLFMLIKYNVFNYLTPLHYPYEN